jgi:hypothetical protein
MVSIEPFVAQVKRIPLLHPRRQQRQALFLMRTGAAQVFRTDAGHVGLGRPLA